MKRILHDLVQGTLPWQQFRLSKHGASEAAAMLGLSPYMKRSELLRMKHAGMPREFSEWVHSHVLDRGHAVEAMARPHIEKLINDDLYPVTYSFGNLSASCDGLTLDGTIAMEHKQWSESLAARLHAGEMPEEHIPQCQQVMMVTGAARCLFVVSDGTPERMLWKWVDADESWFTRLTNGWSQFDKDLADYVPPADTEPAPVGKAPDTLPALRIEVTGAVTASNLAEFKQTALSAIRGVNRDLKTDADFADADKAVKWCSDVESRLKAAKEHALSQTADIDALFKTLDDIATEARTVRLDLDKLVTKRKTEVKEQAVLAARKALDAHVAKLNGELAPMGLHLITADFAGAIKGLRSIASMQDALDTTLANAKIEADAQAAAMRHNINVFKAAAAGYEFLFADLHVIVHKAAEDFALLVDSRVAAHKAAEQKRKEAEEAARQKAEAERLEREAEAKREFDKEVAIRIAADLAPPPVAPTVTPRLRNLMAATMAIAGPHALEMLDISAEHFADDGYSNDKQPAAIPLPDQSPATLKLGEICAMFGVTMTAAFVADTLGVPHRATDKAAKLYRQSDVALIGRALQRHIGRAIELQAV